MIFLLCNAIAAQTGDKIRGKVTDANGASVSDAEVVLQRKDVRFERVTVTQADGKFEFTELAEGNYVLMAKARNFGSITKSVSLKNTEEIELKLSPNVINAEVSVIASSLAGTPESLERIPGSIEKVDSQTLENSRVFNFSEALRKISGVNVRDEEGFGLRPNIGIRGTNPTRSTKVLLLEDGIPFSYAPYGDNASYYHPPVERYESIEVLKGSGQIAYGPVTLAGVVNYLTPNPPEKPTFSLKLVGGNRRFFNGIGTFGGTFGKTGLLLSYSRKQGAGARDNINSKLNDFSTKITRTLNEKNFLTGRFSYYREDSNIAYTGATENEFAQNPRGNIFKNDFFYGRRTGVSLTHSAIFTPNASLSTNFYGAYFSRDWWRQSSNSGQRPNRLNVDPDCLSLAQLNTTCGNEGRLRDYRVYGVEPRLTLNYQSGNSFRGELQTGFRVHFEEQRRIQRNGDLPNSRTGTISEFNLRNNTAYSGFIQNRFIFGRLAITPGIRIERVELERQNNLATATFSGAFGKSDLTQVIPGIGIAVNAFKNTTIFAGAHRGFAPPRTEDVISNTGGIIDLNSELSWNYELGIRTRPLRGIALEATAFRLDYENQIVPASLAGGIGSAFTNGGQTLQQGFELNAQIDSGTIFNSKHNFYLRTAYTYLPMAEFRGRRFSSVSGFTSVSVSGNRLPYAPENLLTASVGYSNPLGFDGFIETVYIGNQFTDDLNTRNTIPNSNGQRGLIPSQTYFNATANYKVERWRTTFFVTVKNLFDKVYIVDRARGLLPGSPRLVQAGIKLNF